MTTTIYPPSRHPRWEAIKRSFTQSNYITDFWNWLMTLLSKAAELVLFGSVLYSGYQLLPGITHAPAGVDALVFVVQQAALDIGGMGLLKLAKRAGLPKESFPVRVGITLVVLMILNVVLASLKQAVPVIPAAVFLWIETILLVARAIMAVLFGHAIQALREEYGETTITVKDAGELQQQVEALASKLAQVRLHFQQRLQREGASLHEQLARELSQREQSLHQCLSESASQLARNLHEQFAQELSSLHESLQQQQEVLAQVPDMQAALERIQRQVAERPVLRALPSVGQGSDEAGIQRVRQSVPPGATREKFDARAFVFSCLQENAACKLRDIQQLAGAKQRDLSEATISRYRKQFFARRESPVKAASESTSMQGESGHESFHREERKVVGE
jgi:hypothetical protein